MRLHAAGLTASDGRQNTYTHILHYIMCYHAEFVKLARSVKVNNRKVK